jgi:hypothetical protein
VYEHGVKPKVDDRVLIRGCSDHDAGIVTADVPEKMGCMVRPDGCEHSYGWGYGELEVIPSRTAWERLVGPDVDFG